MKAIKNVANWFLALFCLEAILPIYINSQINSAIFWLIILSSLYCALLVNAKYYESLYFGKFNWLILMFVIYGIVYYLFGPSYLSPATGLPLNKLSYTTAILKSLLPVYTFYYLTRRGLLTSKMISKWIPIFLVVGIIFYNDEMQRARVRLFMAEDVTNNAGYYMLSMLPLMLFWRKSNVLQYSGMLLVAILVIFSMKRGAIFVMVFMLLFYFYKTMKSRNKKISPSIVLSSSTFMFGMYYFITEYMMDNEYFVYRINDTLQGNSSSRFDLYSAFWTHIVNCDILNLLFGSGANYTLNVSYNYAHNDWLEIGVNQGLVGVIVFAAYWFGLLKKYKHNCLISPYDIMLGMVIINVLSRTVFSMSYSDTTFFSNIGLGYCLAHNDMNSHNS